MTSARPSATLYREGTELDDLLAELDEAHPGQVRVVDVTYGRDGGVLGFFAKRRVGVRYALDTDAPAARRTTCDVDAAAELPAPRSRHAASPLEDLLSAADAAEAEAMVDHGVAPDGAPDQPNVEFARLLLEMAMTKASQRRASEDAARAAFVEGGTHVVPAIDPEPVLDARPRPPTCGWPPSPRPARAGAADRAAAAAGRWSCRRPPSCRRLSRPGCRAARSPLAPLVAAGTPGAARPSRPVRSCSRLPRAPAAPRVWLAPPPRVTAPAPRPGHAAGRRRSAPAATAPPTPPTCPSCCRPCAAARSARTAPPPRPARAPSSPCAASSPSWACRSAGSRTARPTATGPSSSSAPGWRPSRRSTSPPARSS